MSEMAWAATRAFVDQCETEKQMFERELRPRRSNLAVPGSSPKMLEKAKGLPADQVFLDLEDAVAPLAKPDARKNIVAALNEGGYGEKVRSVRVNDFTTEWTYRDVIEVVEGAGSNLDCIMLPKVQTAEQIVTLDTLLTQIEKSNDLELCRLGIEAQIEKAKGLINVDAIAAASPRVETIIFGPADFMASINMRTLVVGEQPAGYDEGDAYHYILMRILMAARAYDKQAIDGPYLQIRDVEGYRRVAARAAALGFDGKWVLHPGQVDAANEVFSPKQDDFDHAELILDAYAHFTSEAGGKLGAVMLGSEMIDEASRKMALVVSGKGRAAGMRRTVWFDASSDNARTTTPPASS
jgi:citrate lyase subunit beta/citryl-CoA lyase